MAGIIQHLFQCLKADGTDPTQVQPSNWNDFLKLAGGSDGALVVRDMTDSTYGSNYTQSPRVVSLKFNVGVPATPVDGELWVVATGVSPTRTITLNYCDQGTTRVLLQVTV